MRPEPLEIDRLRRDLAKLKAERDILKVARATSIDCVLQGPYGRPELRGRACLGNRVLRVAGNALFTRPWRTARRSAYERQYAFNGE